MKRTLMLALKGVYFDEVKAGRKDEEYRLVNEYWTNKFERYAYDRIVLTRGYPPKNDVERRIERPWRGVEIKMIVHPEFGAEPVQVYAIKLS